MVNMKPYIHDLSYRWFQAAARGVVMCPLWKEGIGVLQVNSQKTSSPKEKSINRQLLKEMEHTKLMKVGLLEVGAKIFPVAVANVKT